MRSAIATVLLFALIPIPAFAANNSTTGGPRPNIIVLLTDDQRWDSLGCMGNPIVQTPNIDRLAAEGVLFRNNFCTTAICCVSRASIFSGQYERSHKIDDFAKTFSVEALAKTYPVLLRNHGYRTGFIGKWGVGNTLPEKEFDYWDGFAGQGNYFDKTKPGHLTQRMSESAARFLKESKPDQPFCLSISFKAPHVQDNGVPRLLPADSRDEKLYQDIVMPAAKTTAERYFEILPDFLKQSEGRIRWHSRYGTPELFQNTVKDYYRLITGVDRVVGELREQLSALKLAGKTVIIFTSDNGFFLAEHGLEGKWFMYEESIRTPLIIFHPSLPQRRRGKRVDPMTLNIDLAPTILGLAGIKPPETMQGKSLKPLVLGQSVRWRDDWFYEHHFEYGGKIPSSEGVRTERWKYIRYIGANPVYEELYDLKNDPREEHNLASAASSQSILKRLRERWNDYRKQLEPAIPGVPRGF